MRRSTSLLSISSLLVASLAILPARADDPPGDTFEEATDVIEVQVPVNVVDRHGEAVRGLTKDDFRVFDDGDLQEITDFRVVDLEVLHGEESRSVDETTVPAVARRHFLFLFDLSFANPSSVIRAREAAQQFVLENLHPTDLAAVATFSLDAGPRLVVTFTPDRAQLARAIDTLGAPRLLESRGSVDPLRFMIDDPELSTIGSSTFAQNESQGAAARMTGAEAEVRAYLDIIATQMTKMEKSYRRGRVSSWLRSLEDMAKVLGNVEGRKHVVFFSEGFDGRLMLGRPPDGFDQQAQRDQLNLQYGQYWMVDTDDIYGNSALQGEVNDMVEEFRRNDAIIQAVDISGLRADAIDTKRARQVGQDALFFIANETGGQLFEDANDLGYQLDQVLERSSVTYLLTFRPEGLLPDGSYHELKVKVDAPRGTDVTHRDGYYAPRPYGELHPLEKSLLASDAIAAAEPRSGLDIDVLAAPFRATPERAYIPVIIEVDGDSLLRGTGTDRLSIEFYAYVTNERGEMRDFFTQLVTLDLDRGREAIEQTGVKYYGHLDLGPGDHLVRVLVRNADTGRTGVRSVPVRVPEYEDGSPDLLPPFFFEPPGRWVLVRENRGGNQGSVVYPFTVNGDPYIPAARPTLPRDGSADLVLVAYGLEDEDVELDATVVGSDGSELDGGRFALVERTVTGIRGLDKLLATFESGGLASGDYTLRVAVRQPGSGVEEVESIPFSVADRR